MVACACDCLQVRRVRPHAHGVVFPREEDEIPPLAGHEANVVIGEQTRKEGSSGKQVLLEVEDWAVVDVLARLAEEPDSERGPRLHESAQLRHDEPMRLARARPGSAGEARAHAGNQRRPDPRKRGKIIERASRVREGAPQNRLARRKTET
jgi:hypothetical protein